MGYRFLSKILLAFILLGLASPGPAAVDGGNPSAQAIGTHIKYLTEGADPLKLREVLGLFSNDEFTASVNPILNFGIGSRPVWLAFEVKNSLPDSVTRRLMIENSWLDHISVFFRHNNKTVAGFIAGDALPQTQRGRKQRFFAFDHEFEPGISTVFIRIETPDPMVIPVYLMDLDLAQEREVRQGYSYGFIYGVIIALFAYNLMIYFGLRSRRYLYYSIYLASFLILNMSYTGHGFQWAWPQSPGWQQWSNPVLMLVYGLCGLLFATRFLDTKNNLPSAHRAVKFLAAIFSFMLLMSVLIGSHVMALFVAFIFVFLFSSTMLLLGGVSLYRGKKSAKYFLFASVSAMVGASLTAASVWGFIPFNGWTYRAVEIGMLLDAVLLALALGDQFRIGQEEKIQAERLSKVDPLTGLNNRRAFYDATAPMWSSALRSHRDMSVIMLDIDKFKDINDTFGHAYGDVLLIETAKALKEACREGDILTRWGGEEFLLFLPETDLDNALTLAERLREKISTLRVDVGQNEIGFTASFGVAEKDTRSSNLDALISAADRQLYKAKASGRNKVCA